VLIKTNDNRNELKQLNIITLQEDLFCQDAPQGIVVSHTNTIEISDEFVKVFALEDKVVVLNENRIAIYD